MKRLEKISVLTAKLKKAVAEEGIGGLAGRTKGYLARAKKEKEFQREKSRAEALDGTLLRRVRDFPLPDDGHPAGICHNGKADEQASVVRCG